MTKLSPTQKHAITQAKRLDGRLYRHSGGRWTERRWAPAADDWYCSTNTARALVAKGAAKWTRYQDLNGERHATPPNDGRTVPYPVELEVK